LKEKKKAKVKVDIRTYTKRPFGIVFVIAFHQILNFFFAKIKCGLYFLDRFDVLMSKIIFKK
jgi:hypothetical protein